jgi:hypothetical protein
MGFCVVLIVFSPGFFSDFSAAACTNEALVLTDTFLHRCRQEDEPIPDEEYRRLIALCRQTLSQNSLVTGKESEKIKSEKNEGTNEGSEEREFFSLRLNEIELYTFWSIDGYLEDLVKLQAALKLLDSCKNDLKTRKLWETDRHLTGRCLYLQASLYMLEVYRSSRLPQFEAVLPLLRKARDFLAGSKEEILALHSTGRAYADLAFDDEIPEERYEALMGSAVGAFKEALALSSRYDAFMRVTLTAQLGNALNNLDESAKALEMLQAALSAVGPGREPNRFLALHLDIAQALTGRYLETLKNSDLLAAEKASERAFLVSNSLAPSRVVPHVRFNLAMTLFTIAREKHDPALNAQAIHEIEKVLDIWTLDGFADLHLLASDALCRFLAVQESMTRDALVADKAINFIVGLVTRCDTKELRSRHRKALSVLYERLADFYFKRALYQEGEKQREAYNLSETAARKSEELRKNEEPKVE